MPLHRSIFTALAAAILALSSTGCRVAASGRAPLADPPGWMLAWNDEFDGPAGAAPDSARWTHDIGGGGWGNAEWQYYTDTTANAALDGVGALVITATTAPAGSLQCWYGACTHTSARLLTKGKFAVVYGRIEARIRIPRGQGLWPAFWMLGNDIDAAGWPTCGEIDIMENIGREPAVVHGALHGPGYSGAQGLSGAYSQAAPFADADHVFAVEWEPQRVRWSVDGSVVHTRTVADLPAGADWVFDHPFFILLNVAVGGNWPGYPDATTVFPQTMRVDYVRVYWRSRATYLPVAGLQ